ncbi:MAG: dTDP-4-dehydrorhamnose 3,5-epimerase [Bacteroidia bacterium]
MEAISTPIEGLYIIKPRVFTDDRGAFFESFNLKTFQKITGTNVSFVQDNISTSNKNVVRGLHFQAPPFAQGKLVSVVKGKALDVAVDIRKKSPTYGQHYSIELSSENKLMFWIPEGFAHGFSALEDDTIFSYKCTNYYHKESEVSILYNDPKLNINWGVSQEILSEKDKLAQPFSTFVSPF